MKNSKQYRIKNLKVLKRDWKCMWKTIVALLVVEIVLFVSFHSVCPFRIITGYPCPGCGLIHAAISLLNLDFTNAIRQNATIFLWIPLILWAVVRRYVREKNMRPVCAIGVIVAIITFVVYTYRLLYQFPSSYPMYYEPHNLISMLRKLLQGGNI